MRTPGVSKGIFSAAGNRWRPGLPVALFILLASIYMLTWSGRINSQDARLMLNASSSLVRFGDMRADLAAGETPPAPGKLATEQGVRSLPEIQVEPLQPLLAAPLYWLALHVPGAGLAHSVYLFNVLVSAAAGSLMFLYSRRLGYSEAAAVLAALALGLATIVWTYSDSFFQAPLALLFILLAACQLEQLREGGRRRPAAVLMAALTLLLMPFARHSTLLALPALVIIAVPTVDLRPATGRWLIPVIPVAVVLMPVLLILLLQNSSILQHLPGLPDWIGPGHYAGVIHSYLLSPGGSLWGTSPILLLALPGAWLLWRAGKRRHVLAALALVATFALVFAWWQGVHWFGGLSWPPRFLIPVVPLVLLTAMPVLERLTQSSRSRWLLPAVALLAAGSLWVQLGAISLPWEVYGHALPPEAGGHGDWSGGLNLLRWMRWIVIPGLWSSMAWDFAWIRTGTLTWPLLFGGSALYAAWRIRRHFGVAGVAGARAPRLTTLLHLTGMLALMFAGLALLPRTRSMMRPTRRWTGCCNGSGRKALRMTLSCSAIWNLSDTLPITGNWWGRVWSACHFIPVKRGARNRRRRSFPTIRKCCYMPARPSRSLPWQTPAIVSGCWQPTVPGSPGRCDRLNATWHGTTIPCVKSRAGRAPVCWNTIRRRRRTRWSLECQTGAPVCVTANTSG